MTAVEDNLDLHKLLFLLKTLDLSDLPDYYYIYLSNWPRSDEITNIINLANTVLIDEDGHNSHECEEYLRSNGFSIFPGEQDSFGWLTGCIQTKKGIIVYG
jgi:hypothetical protein